MGQKSSFAGDSVFPLLVVAATAFAVIVPFLFLGDPSGHDFEFHMHSWMEVLGQWRQWIFYPRWAALAHYGYGEPRFIFYPPASWMLGAALGAFLPWKVVPGAYVWLVLTFSGCSLFLLARRWLDRSNATFAAALYAANPYFILMVYWRSSFAELFAGAFLPLLMHYMLREERDQPIVPLALIVAAACLTNAPASLMVTYSIALLAVTLAVLQRSPRIILSAAVAGLIGAALAAFYILPAMYEQKWVNIAEILAPGVRPQDNFLFTRTTDGDHNRFNLLISIVASAELIVLAIACFCSRGLRREKPRIWWTLVVWAGAAVLLMFSFADLFWRHLPLLRFLQLPWRWLLCLNVAFALLVATAWRRWLWRTSICLAMLAVVIFVWHRIQTPWWDNARDISEMLGYHERGAGYEGTDEYAPQGADPYNIKRDAPLVAAKGVTAQIKIQKWNPESKSFVVDLSQPASLVLRLFNYPAWRIEVNGRLVEATTLEDTGQIVIPVEAGKSNVQLSFARTTDRTAGGIISILTAVCLLMWWLRKRLRVS